MVNNKYGVDFFAERMDNRSVSSSEKERRIIVKKREEIAFLDSRFFHMQSKQRQKDLEASAKSLPLECWGVCELVIVKDLRNGMTHRVSKSGVDEFFENHPRPYDLVVETC